MKNRQQWWEKDVRRIWSGQVEMKSAGARVLEGILTENSPLVI
jgi:hypothetical protein